MSFITFGTPRALVLLAFNIASNTRVNNEDGTDAMSADNVPIGYHSIPADPTRPDPTARTLTRRDRS